MLRTVAGTFAAVAALGIGVAAPAVAAPVPVTGLNCDGDTYKCTANLRFGDGNWKANWNVSVFHQATRTVTPTVAAPSMAAPFLAASAPRAAAPVPVTGLNCDGDTYKCTANLQFGDGKWKASWNVSVFHQATRAATPALAAKAPVPVTGLSCDGDTNKCTANLKFGDGNWKAAWNVTVFHQA
ncbi:hypothetical protein ACFVWX_14495 [Streptomyces sp. NPDC058220]|uniref:hypothetical protein n=1 Tax=unclassified Streptomyces TaxID=2593676 RepID=UPI003656566A